MANVELIATGLGIVTTLASGGAAWVSLRLRADLAEMRENLRSEMAKDRLDHEKRRAEDKNEMRDWINGSFMRARVVQAMIDSTNQRLESLEDLARKMALQ